MSLALLKASASEDVKNYLVPVEFARRQQQCIDVVCRILKANKEYGTGFLIGRQIIMTNNHVLPNKESCKGAVAQFFYEEGRSSIDVPFDEEACFVTSDSPGDDDPPTEDHLDFTIVALKTVEEKPDLFRIYSFPLSIFKDVVEPEENDEAFIIQHPKGSDTKISWGLTHVNQIDPLAVHYDTITDEGSSGSPVLNAQRRLYGLHRLGNCTDHTDCNQGVLISAIAKFLSKKKDLKVKKTYREIIEKWVEKKEAPLLKIAGLNWKKARGYLEKARKYFNPSSKPSEQISRKNALSHFDQAISALEEALEQYKNPQDTESRAGKLKIETELFIAKWQRRRVLFDLLLPKFVPVAEEQQHTIIDLLRDPEQQISTLQEWLNYEIEKTNKSLGLKDNPTICFLIAFIAGEHLNLFSVSANWYLLLAACYDKREDSPFLIRECLTEACKQFEDIQKDAIFETLNKKTQEKIKSIVTKFEESLIKIKTLSKTKRQCFILYDKEAETRTWLETHHFIQYLKQVGVEPHYDIEHPSVQPQAFATNALPDSDFILTLCSPSFFEKSVEIIRYMNASVEDKNCTELSTSMDNLHYEFTLLFPRLTNFIKKGKILGIIHESTEAESLPIFLSALQGRCYSIHPDAKYYTHIVQILAKIKGHDGGGGGEIETLIHELALMAISKRGNDALAESGDADALYRKGFFLNRKSQPDYDRKKALECFEQAAKKGEDRAQVAAGLLYLEDGRQKEAVRFFLDAEKKGNITALEKLQHCYSEGIGVEKSITKAEKYKMRIHKRIGISDLNVDQARKKERERFLEIIQMSDEERDNLVQKFLKDQKLFTHAPLPKTSRARNHTIARSSQSEKRYIRRLHRQVQITPESLKRFLVSDLSLDKQPSFLSAKRITPESLPTDITSRFISSQKIRIQIDSKALSRFAAKRKKKSSVEKVHRDNTANNFLNSALKIKSEKKSSLGLEQDVRERKETDAKLFSKAIGEL